MGKAGKTLVVVHVSLYVHHVCVCAHQSFFVKDATACRDLAEVFERSDSPRAGKHSLPCHSCSAQCRRSAEKRTE